MRNHHQAARGARHTVGVSVAGLCAFALTGLGAEGLARSSAGFAQDAEARVLSLIGLVEGPEEYLFGEIVGVALDPEGRIYVADGLSSDLRVFREDGTFLARIGREGEGPGEFQRLSGLAFAPDGRLYVRGGRSLTVLRRSETTGLWDEVEATWLHGATVPARRGRRMVDSLGRFHEPSELIFTDGRTPEFRYLVHRSDRTDKNPPFGGGGTWSLLPVPDYGNLHARGFAGYLTGGGGGRVVPGLERAPFEPAPAWDLTPSGTVIGGEGGRYVLHETTAEGDTLRVIRRERPRRPVPPPERDDSLAALQERIEEIPVSMEDLFGASDLAARGQVPDSLPAFIGIQVTGEGDVWVELWSRRPGTRVFDVLDPAGELRFTMQVPVALAGVPSVVARGRRAVGVVRDPLTEIQRVVVLELPEPDR